MIGGEIGSYRITSSIGEGGMGHVYLAEHKLLGRRAAVKVLLPELSTNQEIVQRFFNEARATTQIRHPSIVDVFDFGYHTDGSAFIVMEFLDGESLTARLRRKGGKLPIDQAVSFTRQIAGALGAAHATGIVHRDLKPDNIFIVKDPEVVGGERIKILDFGIAKIRNSAVADGAKTRTGSVMGTPVYMSPEQCRGLSTTNHRTDIYALGCVFFELLCGRPPFPGDSIGALVAAHVYTPPPTPSSIDPSMPPDIDRIMARCLDKNVDTRYQVMNELIVDLDASFGTGAAQREGSGLHPISPAQNPAYRSQPPVYARTGPPAPWSKTGSSGMQPNQPDTTLRDAEPPSAVKRLGGSTTLGGASGEQSAQQQGAPRKKPVALIAVAVVSVCAIAGGAIAIATGGGGSNAKTVKASATDVDSPDPKQPEPAQPEPKQPEPKQPEPQQTEPEQPKQVEPAKVKLTIETDPPGAEVFLVATGLRLGETPYTYEVPPVAGAEALFLIKKSGYEYAKLTMPADKDNTVTQKLKKKASATPRPTTGTGDSELLEPK